MSWFAEKERGMYDAVELHNLTVEENERGRYERDHEFDEEEEYEEGAEYGPDLFDSFRIRSGRRLPLR